MRKQMKSRKKLSQKLTMDQWIAVPRNAFVEKQWFPAPPNVSVEDIEPGNDWIERLLVWDYGQDFIRDYLLDNGNRNERIQLAKERYGLKELAHDSDWEVRKAVAEQGYAQELLSKDPVAEVRVAVEMSQRRLRREIHSRDIYTRVCAIAFYTWKGKREINEIMRIMKRPNKQHLRITYK